MAPVHLEPHELDSRRLSPDELTIWPEMEVGLTRAPNERGEASTRAHAGLTQATDSGSGVRASARIDALAHGVASRSCSLTQTQLEGSLPITRAPPPSFVFVSHFVSRSVGRDELAGMSERLVRICRADSGINKTARRLRCQSSGK